MKLFLLERDREHVGYDESYGAIVRAEDEEEARLLACAQVDGDFNDWTNRELVKCHPINARGKRGVVMIDFRGG